MKHKSIRRILRHGYTELDCKILQYSIHDSILMCCFWNFMAVCTTRPDPKRSDSSSVSVSISSALDRTNGYSVQNGTFSFLLKIWWSVKHLHLSLCLFCSRKKTWRPNFLHQKRAKTGKEILERLREVVDCKLIAPVVISANLSKKKKLPIVFFLCCVIGTVFRYSKILLLWFS